MKRTAWTRVLGDRLAAFARSRSAPGRPLSIKIRVQSGCYERSCCSNAHRIIDQYRNAVSIEDAEYVEHESGPEILVWLAVGTAGLSLAKSIVDLICVVIKARSEGATLGDKHREPLELIVRDVDETGEPREERILKFHSDDPVNPEVIGAFLDKALTKLSRSPELRSRKKNRESKD
jgi:hypothetical protein